MFRGTDLLRAAFALFSNNFQSRTFKGVDNDVDSYELYGRNRMHGYASSVPLLMNAIPHIMFNMCLTIGGMVK